MSAIVRSVDVGFGYVKYAVPAASGAIECSHFPAVAMPSVLDTSRRPGLGGRRRTVSIFVGDLFYEVGPDIHFAGALARPALSIERYVEAPEYLALLRGALHFMQVDQIDLLVVGLPVALFMQRKTQLERLACGEHHVGRGRTVTVARALAVAQPLGALVSYADQHQSVAKIQRQENLIVDAGSRTFDWLCARGLRLVANRSHSAAYGVYNITSSIAVAISDVIKESFDDLDAIDLALRNVKPMTLFGTAHSMQPYRPIVESIAREAVRAMSLSIGGKYRFDNVVLVGGGAHLFKRAIREAFPKQRLQEVAEPFYANVRGFQRAGMDKVGAAASSNTQFGENNNAAAESA